MNIALIDNEYCTRKKHDFPNLALMKISAYHKNIGNNVELVNFDMIDPNALFNKQYDKIYLSKVFSDTFTPDFIDTVENLEKGGSGFYYDLAPKLPDNIEHIKPDYNLYNNLCSGKYYTDFSIGFMTRGCIRQCEFCINRNSKKVEHHANIEEFLCDSKPYIMLLDDNITAYKGFYDVFDSLNKTGKPFVFKQGMDFRLLSLKKMQKIWDSNYYSSSSRNKKSGRTFFYAFDNIKDYNIIDKKLNLYMSNIPYKHNLIFYTIVGFDYDNKYSDEFYKKDIENLFIRIKLLFEYGVFAYVMLHENYTKNPNSNIIKQIRRLCNAPIHIAGKKVGDALLQMKYYKTYDFIKDNYHWFLDVKQNVKNIKV